MLPENWVLLASSVSNGPFLFGTELVGNTTADTSGRTFVYDAENKQVEVIENSTTIGEYFYDGDGKRVKKVVPATNETTVFVYDAIGQLVAEYSTQIPQASQISYLTHDYLGSPRILTDQLGAVISRRDFHPFGEEIVRSGYGQDTVREKFATYESDTESDLDFAQARYYSSRLGRFFSIDPGNADADQEVPQSWNAYAYARNNPLKYGDPSGERVEVCSVGGERTCVYYSEAQWIKFLDANKKSGDFTIKGNKIFFGDEIAAEITSSTFLDDRPKEFISSTAENSVKKGKVVGALGAGAVVTGACIGTGVCAVIGSALLTRVGSRIGAQAVEKAIERVVSNPNTLNHIFQAKHLLGQLVRQLGSKTAVVAEVLGALAGKLPSEGKIDVAVTVAGYTDRVTGVVQDGVIKISNFWVPSK